MARIIVKFPTRHRVDRATATLRRWRETMSDRHEVGFIVTCDRDDIGSLSHDWDGASRPARGAGGVVCRHTTDPGGKIHACNAGTPPEHTWDILIMGSDDLEPEAPHWDAQVVAAMEAEFPNLDGALWFSDGLQSELCTYPIYGREWHRKAGAVYDPAYRSLFADNEAHEVAAARDRLRYDPRVILRHRHWVNGAAEIDGVYRAGEADWQRDQAVYGRRRAAGFGWPPIDLSVLIPSVRARAPMLRTLLDELNRQASALDLTDRRRVEIVTLVDDGHSAGGDPVGRKRARLLRRALGRWVAFIDDDDGVHPAYLARVLDALASGPDAVGFTLARHVPGANAAQHFVHTHRYRFEPPAGSAGRPDHWRPINHLNPVRRELALAAGYNETMSFGEDSDYALRLAPSLGRVVEISGEPMYAYFDNPATSRTRGLIAAPAPAPAGPGGPGEHRGGAGA